MTRCHQASGAAALATMIVASGASAAEPRLLDRPHTVAVAELGVLALPDAPISAGQKGGDTPFGAIGRGDATLLAGMHIRFRPSPTIALGAGVAMGLSPTSDTQYGTPNGLARTHSRSYFTLGGELMYYPLRFRAVELWVGVGAGAVIVGDRYSTDTAPPVPTNLGNREVTVRTEGFSFGAHMGADWLFADQWALGLALRSERWLLPNAPRCSAIGDCSTLLGVVVAWHLGLNIGYRISL